MALDCDMIVAARDPTFGFTEVTFGLVPPKEESQARCAVRSSLL